MKPTVADIMNPELLYLAKGSRVELARDPILNFGVTAVPVLDDDGKPVGIVSLRDLLAGEAPREPTAPAFSVVSTTPIDAAARALAETDYHHLVVIDEKTGRAVGMVSTGDLLRALLDMPVKHPRSFPAFRGQPHKLGDAAVNGKEKSDKEASMLNKHEDVRREMNETVAQLRALRDEAKLKIHLASMDARASWDSLQPKLQEAEHAAEQATSSALVSLQETAKKLRQLVKSL